MGLVSDRRPVPLALTMGDPAGIGLEIALLAWQERQTAGVPAFALYGCPEALATRAGDLDLKVPIEPVGNLEQAVTIFATHLPVLPLPLAAPVEAGAPDVRNAPVVIASIEMATEAAMDGSAAAVVTNPIAKSILTKAGFAHPGHTEFLGYLATRRASGRTFKPVMMLASEELRVVPLTVHIPLVKVPPLISEGDIIATVRIMDAALRRDFAIRAPRIAVAGLNPHAGESGTLGSEDAEVIVPALAALKAEGLMVSGPHPADTLFHVEARRTYDAVLAMYHDQALIPIKTLAFDRGVNVTLGLPFVRTSPDHGTAFDIAGRGIANPRSLIESLKLAAAMAERRELAKAAEKAMP